MSVRNYDHGPNHDPQYADYEQMSWHQFYTACRSEMEFRYGKRRIPKDYYREKYALGASITSAVRDIAKRVSNGVPGR